MNEHAKDTCETIISYKKKKKQSINSNLGKAYRTKPTSN